MGWTFTPKPKHCSPAKFLEEKIVRWNVPDEAHPKVVKSRTYSNRVIFAVNFPSAFFTDPEKPQQWKDHYIANADGSVTVPFIILYRYAKGDYNFGYKDMDEIAGPSETVHPTFLSHLSELRPDHLHNNYALAWREKCRNSDVTNRSTRSLIKQITPGTRIVLKSALLFRDIPCQQFVAVQERIRKRGGGSKLTLCYMDIETRMLCKIPEKHLSQAQIFVERTAPQI